MQGYREAITIIITTYNLCHSKTDYPNMVYMLQNKFFISALCNIFPREALQQDLSAFIVQCQQQGEQVIVSIYLNKDNN